MRTAQLSTLRALVAADQEVLALAGSVDTAATFFAREPHCHDWNGRGMKGVCAAWGLHVVAELLFSVLSVLGAFSANAGHST